MIDNNTIILVTPVLRTDNLIHIAKNIVKRFSTQDKYTPFWVICMDQYHADLSVLKIKKLEVYLLENNIPYRVYYQGVEADANYGGTLMNAPLMDIQKICIDGVNPWVYVLDDDNIISRNFFRFLNEYVSDSDEIWHMNMLDEYGSHIFSRKMDFLASRLNGETLDGLSLAVIHPCAVCDPSQLLIRLNRLIDLGGFGSDRMYDFDFMNKFMRNDKNCKNILKTQGTVPNMRNHDFYLACYHNGLVRNQEIHATISELDNDSQNDSYLRVHTKNHNFNIELSNEEVKEILKTHLQDEKE